MDGSFQPFKKFGVYGSFTSTHSRSSHLFSRQDQGYEGTGGEKSLRLFYLQENMKKNHKTESFPHQEHL